MPAMIVPSTCSACGQARKFIEFKAEPCTPRLRGDGVPEGTSGPGAEGERRYGFRCLSCKAIVPELVSQDGRRHFWSEGQHLEA